MRAHDVITSYVIINTQPFQLEFRLRNDQYCVGWGVKLYTLTRQMSIAIHAFTWITGVETIKTADEGCVRSYGCRPKSASAGLRCGLGWTPTLYVTRSVVEAARAACGAIWVSLTLLPFIIVIIIIIIIIIINRCSAYVRIVVNSDKLFRKRVQLSCGVDSWCCHWSD